MKTSSISLLLAAVAPFTTALNYSVQLLEDVAFPDDFQPEDKAAAADEMITKTGSEPISSLLEDLAIKLQEPEEQVRALIDAERAALNLPPLPPWDMELDMSKRLNRAFSSWMPVDEDMTEYLPDGWTESRYDALTIDDLKTLSEEELENLLLKAQQEERQKEKDHNKPDYFETLPQKTLYKMTDYLHEQIREMSGVPPGVRAYKRNVAPVVQAVAALDPEKWGYVLYRTTYKNETAWKEFEDQFKLMNDRDLENSNKGEGLDLIKENFEVYMATDGEMEDGADFAACVKHFKDLQNQGHGLPDGIEIPLILVVDEQSLSSITNFKHGIRPFLWAVDAKFDAKKESKFPKGYPGMFKIHYMAPIHELYAPIASYFMTPAELWSSLQDTESKSELIEEFIEDKARAKRDANRYKKVGGAVSDQKRSRPTEKNEL